MDGHRLVHSDVGDFMMVTILISQMDCNIGSFMTN